MIINNQPNSSSGSAIVTRDRLSQLKEKKRQLEESRQRGMSLRLSPTEETDLETTTTPEKQIQQRCRQLRNRPWRLFLHKHSQPNTTLKDEENTKNTMSLKNICNDATISTTSATTEGLIVEITPLQLLLPEEKQKSTNTTVQGLRDKLRSAEHANYCRHRKKDSSSYYLVPKQEQHQRAKLEPRQDTPEHVVHVEQITEEESLTTTTTPKQQQQQQQQVEQQLQQQKPAQPSRIQQVTTDVVVVVSLWTNCFLLGGLLGLALPPMAVTAALAAWMLYGSLYMTNRWAAHHLAQEDVQRFLRFLSKSWRRFGAEVKKVLEGDHSRQVVAAMVSYAAIRGQSPLKAFLRYHTSLVNRKIVTEYQQAINVFRKHKDFFASVGNSNV